MPHDRGSDSALVVCSDLATRSVDTVASVRIPRIKNTVKADDQNCQGIETTHHRFRSSMIGRSSTGRSQSFAVATGHVDCPRRDGGWESPQSCRLIGSD